MWVDLHRWWTQLRCGHPWFEEFRSVGESEEQCPAFRWHISRWCSSSMGRNAWHGLCWRVYSLAHHFNSCNWRWEDCFHLMVATLPSQNTTWLEVLLQLGQLEIQVPKLQRRDQCGELWLHLGEVHRTSSGAVVGHRRLSSEDPKKQGCRVCTWIMSLK